MALPVAQALAARAQELVICGPRWAPELYQGLGARFLPPKARPEGSLAVVLPPSFSSAWQLRHIPQRVGVRGQGRSLLLSDSFAPDAALHRTEIYAAVAALAGVAAQGPPRLDWDLPVGETPAGHLALAPLSPSGAPVMWPGFEALGQRERGPVVVYLGPGEHWAGGPEWPRVGHPSLVRVAAELLRARALVVNDSGYSHFARALGVPTLVVHGSTIPERTGALGSHPVLSDLPPRCAPCYAKTCAVPGVPCLAIPPERVTQTLAGMEAP